MSAWIEIIIALLIVGIIAAYLNYVIGIFAIIPTSILVFILFAIALDVALFVIHRKS